MSRERRRGTRLPLAPDAPQGCVARAARSRGSAAAAPLPRAGFAVGGAQTEQQKRRANMPAAAGLRDATPAGNPDPLRGEIREMSAFDDPELERFRQEINCAALLERWSPPWRLDKRESTRKALKYRRGIGEILIVNHEGHGWWNPLDATAKGDVFDLVRYLEPGLNFGQVRQRLRQFIGVAPTFPVIVGDRWRRQAKGPPARRWMQRPRLRQGSASWTYLSRARSLPADVLAAADAADSVREGHRGSAWFAHQDNEGAITHVEVRGPTYKGSLEGGTKTLFRLPGAAPRHCRLVLTEAPIDALSVAAIENIQADTLYGATGGGMGPATIEVLHQLLARVAELAGAVFVSATDANRAGDRYASGHAELATAAGIAFERLRPPEGTDWNDVVRAGRGHDTRPPG